MKSTMMEKIQKSLVEELQQTYPDIMADSLTEMLARIFDKTGEKFVFIIDEWDCIFREKRENEEGHITYLDFLRNLQVVLRSISPFKNAILTLKTTERILCFARLL